MIINGENLILGRLASYAAKKALLGEAVNIVNCDKIAITGKKETIFELYKKRKDRGTHKGPFLHRSPDRIVRRAIRGMLPYKQDRGKRAFKSIRCYTGIPSQFNEQKMDTLNNASLEKLKNTNYVYIKDVSKFLGGKIWVR